LHIVKSLNLGVVVVVAVVVKVCKGIKMPRLATPLTDTQIKKAKPKEKVYRLSDGNGLSIEIKPNGSKIWRFRYFRPLTKKANTLSFGSYPEVSLKQAREMAQNARTLLSQDKDPAKHLASKRNIITFKQVVDEFFETKKQEWTSEKYYKQSIKRVENYFGSLYERDIAKITKQELIEIIENIKNIRLPYDTKNRDKFETTVRMYRLLRGIFKKAVHKEYIDANIVDNIDIREIVPPKRKIKTEPFEGITDLKELQKAYKFIVNEYPTIVTKNALQFMILAGLRPGNIRNLKWEYVDFNKKIITYPEGEVKMWDKVEYILPLTDTLIGILKEMEQYTKNRNKYVFCSPLSLTKQIDENTLNRALKRLEINSTAHGFRKSFSTICHENKQKFNFSKEAIEIQLAHSSEVGSETMRIYMLSGFVKERMKLLQWYEDVLNGDIDL